MTLADRNRFVSLARSLALAALVVGSFACDKAGEGPKPDDPGATQPPAKVSVAITIAAAQPDGRRDASVTVETSAPLADVQLEFEIPDTCQRVAGAALRKIPSMQPGTPVNQGVAVTCASTTQGALRVK